MKKKIAIHWFRFDLRVSDNPSLNYLSKNYDNIVGIYIFDDINSDPKLGSASKVWLHASLDYLNKQLNGNLIFLKGDAKGCFDQLMDSFDVEEISWNRSYEPWIVKRDKSLKMYLKSKVNVNSFNGSLLWEPWEVLKADSTPYKIFTPFYQRGCLTKQPPRKPISKNFSFFDHKIKSLSVNHLKLQDNLGWENKVINHWEIGESFAEKQMNNFLKEGLGDYSHGRNFPNKLNVSRISPYLHWGQISPNTLWYEAEKLQQDVETINIDIFKSELGWREFFYNLMFHFPNIQSKNLQIKFDKFPWDSNDEYLKSWQKGLTGYPIIDAGMRELWKTGYMHNRLRMITGSFLVKNLLLHWHHGEKWFWDCLFDADYASNSASWQWVAGTGTDAAPYFRIFNPITQGKKFDPEGEYIKKYVPELKNLPHKYLYTPWECPSEILSEVNLKLGVDYPFPVVDIKLSREKALKAFSILKK